MKPDNQMRSTLGRIRGLGSARHGSEAWMTMRLTSLALIPLSLWFLAKLVLYLNTNDYVAVTQWVAHPVCGALLILLIVVGFKHAADGLKEIVEDYVHAECAKLGVLVCIKFGSILFALVGVLAVLKIMFGIS